MKGVVLLSVLAMSAPCLADRAAAKAAYEHGLKQYNLGEYQGALDSFTLAYNEVPDPRLLFNLAQCSRMLGLKSKAVTLYKSYLRESGGAVPNSDEVRKIISMLEIDVAREQASKQAPPQGPEPAAPHGTEPVPAVEERPAVASVPAPVPANEPPVTVATKSRQDTRAGRTKKIAGLAVGIVGVVAMGAGVAMCAIAKSASDDITKAALNHQFDRSKYNAGQSEGIAGGVLLGVGGAAVVAGVIVGVLGLREARSSRVAFVPWINSTSVGAMVEVR